MSYNVLIVPEDPTHNGLLLKPLVTRLLKDCRKPKATVKVLTNPRLRGVDDAMAQLPAIAEAHRHMDLLLCMLDDDGKKRAASLAAVEARARESGVRLLACVAIQEIEVWLLAGHPDKLDRPWNDIRNDPRVKENSFGPFLRKYGNPRLAGYGREVLMQAALRNWQGMLKRCPELAGLRDRIKAIK